VAAGSASDRGDKVNNLLAGIQHMCDYSQIIAIFDSDGRAGTQFLARLVAPLHQEGVAVSTGYRWFCPESITLPIAFLVMWGAFLLAFLASPFGLPWGGAMAIRREAFGELQVEQVWRGALVDDNTLGLILRRARLRPVFTPLSIVATSASFGWHELIEWGRRQLFLLRITFPRDWLGAVFGFALAAFAPPTLLVVSLSAFASLPTRLFALGVLALLIGLGTTALHLAITAGESLARKAGHLPVLLPRCYLLITLGLPWIMLIQILASGWSRRIRWRGVTYEALAYNCTRVIEEEEKAWEVF
jgi:cellulose synthase/poly-beta-1,6-N-acetylglucosamine synthase-like glycosyltransferase